VIASAAAIILSAGVDHLKIVGGEAALGPIVWMKSPSAFLPLSRRACFSSICRAPFRSRTIERRLGRAWSVRWH
jgi:hypothetical protein